MARSRRGGPGLPPARPELLHPLDVQGAAPPGLDVLAEVPAPHGMAAYRIVRAVLAWSRDPAALSPSAALLRLEHELLARGDDPLTSPLALLAGYMARPADAQPRDVAWACFCLVDWASTAGARKTAVTFAQAAALAHPRNARYAWIAARMLTARGFNVEADLWFRRAYRVGLWTEDWESQARALNSLGVLQSERGRLKGAERYYLRAIAVATRRRQKEMLGISHHNLFMVLAERGDRVRAEQSAKTAFTAYGSAHPKLPELAADVAFFWNKVGAHRRALLAFRALLPKFSDREARLRIMAGLLRAAGGSGERELFDATWPLLEEMVADCPIMALRAASLCEAAFGALALGEVDLARSGFTRALEIASACGENDVATLSELGLQEVRGAVDAPAYAKAVAPGRIDRDDDLAIGLAASLTNANVADEPLARRREPLLRAI